MLHTQFIKKTNLKNNFYLWGFSLMLNLYNLATLQLFQRERGESSDIHAQSNLDQSDTATSLDNTSAKD